MTAPRGTLPFHIRAVTANARSGVVELRYGFEGQADFVERIELPAAPLAESTDAFEAAARILLLVAGTSYYKSQAPAEVVVHVPTSPADRMLMADLFDHGLREFAYTNRLSIPLVHRFEWRGGDPDPASPVTPHPSDIGRPLVPFGGGKDSTVVLGLLPEATPVTINGTSTHTAVATALGHDLVSVRRRLDRVPELTSPDSLNGHIPITAIVSAISVLMAARDGFTSVVLANEAAANEPTLVWDGHAVNHQWSKGATFEALLDDSLQQAGIGVRYFSWLRSVAEPQIIALLSAQNDALDLVVSCNRAFAGRTVGGTQEAPQRWCGECPKCVFTFLMLATRLDPARLTRMFGANLLANPDRLGDFAALWAREKPLECVGERVDAATALLQLTNDPNWSSIPLVQELSVSATQALAEGEWDGLGSDDRGLTPRPAPPAFQQRLGEALA